MKIGFSKEAENFLERTSSKSAQKMNLVLHVKEIMKNCYTRIEPDISFEENENYLEGIEKIGDWRGKIDIYLDPAIKPLLENKNEIDLVLKGKLFKTLTLKSSKSQIKLGCGIK